jgi:hypothetical protein
MVQMVMTLTGERSSFKKGILGFDAGAIALQALAFVWV